MVPRREIGSSMIAKAAMSATTTHAVRELAVAVVLEELMSRQNVVVVWSPARRNPMANTSKTKDKVENPEAHFAKPKQVVKDNVLSHDEKKNALNTWEQDERQLLTASNEGMSGSDEGLRVDNDNRLGEVVRAKGEIGEKPKHKPSH
jgi:hypothetical protein